RLQGVEILQPVSGAAVEGLHAMEADHLFRIDRKGAHERPPLSTSFQSWPAGAAATTAGQRRDALSARSRAAASPSPFASSLSAATTRRLTPAGGMKRR